ncbi:hypothetical protein IJ847_01465 [Candidatus Saccharibacteria bacterium]|nr:hypothetical protein [Candidatus Saccharibacteria bacterium]
MEKFIAIIVTAFMAITMFMGVTMDTEPDESDRITADAGIIAMTETTESTASTETTTVTTTTAASTTTSTSTSSTTATSATTETTTTETTTAENAEPFYPTREDVAFGIRDFLAPLGYTDEQIAGVVANAEAESGLQPTLCQNDYYGLFMLMNCPRRQAMFDEMADAGLSQYLGSDYQYDGGCRFANKDDFRAFLDIMMQYTMNPDDSTWYEELYSAQSPEESAEIFLVHYERAVGGSSTIQEYAPYAGLYYQAADSRREAARRWYEIFSG